MDGTTSVNHAGQTARIKMAKEIHSALSNSNLSKDDIYKLHTNDPNAEFTGTYDLQTTWNKLGTSLEEQTDIQSDFQGYLDDFEQSKSS